MSGLATLGAVAAGVLAGCLVLRLQRLRDERMAARAPSHAHPAAAALRARERPLDGREAEALARIEAGLAADEWWAQVYAAITADWRAAR